VFGGQEAASVTSSNMASESRDNETSPAATSSDDQASRRSN